MKRLLLLTLDYPPKRGGVARYLSEMAEYFGEEMTVIDDGLLFKFFWPKWLRAFWPLIKHAWRTDVVVTSHILPLGLVCLIWKRLTKKPYVVILHGMDFALARRNEWKQNLTRTILREAHVVVANTENLAREVLGFVRPREIDVIYPCLSAELVEHARGFERDASVGAHDEQKPIRLLTVARLVPRKGHLEVLEALSLLRHEHRIGPFRYVIVGSGPSAVTIENRTDELKLTDVVEFIRGADDEELIRQYEQADVFVMPTEHMGKDIEGFGTVYIEAAAFGLPSIATDVPGVNEAVLDRQTGLLVPSSAVHELADAIELLAGDPALRYKLGNAGRERALAEFVADQQFVKLRELL